MLRAFGSVFFLFAVVPHLFAQGEARLLRFPTIHDQTAVFGYGGNLFVVSAGGGVARRLTTHDGYESFPRYSPDGKWIAFTGQYDGNTEVFLMPSAGGVPKRLTYTATLGRDDVSDRMGPNNIVMGWKNNREIIFRSRMRDPNDFIGQLFTVDIDGNLPEQIPVPRGGFCSFSPDGTKMAYNRIFREFRTWKRYRGGMADDIWIHDFTTKTTVAVAQDPACDVFPMWHGNRIFFLSDRGPTKRFNLHVYELDTKQTRALTKFEDFDVKYPSLGDKAIVFEQAGNLMKFDLATETTSKISVRILEDMNAGRGGLKDVSKNIGSFEISPDGKRALFSARGDIFTVPAKNGPTRNLTATSGVHDRSPKWSPDGKWIACISDRTGEDEIFLLPQDGKGKPVQLTNSGAPYKYSLGWSPDSKKILWTDKQMRLQMVDVASKEVKLVGESKAWEIRDFSWSPDSKWIAYSRPDVESMQKVILYSLDTAQSVELTDGWQDSYQPVFSGDGKYLFFVSEREFNPTFSQTEWNHAYLDLSRLYFVALTKDATNPFKSKSDEVEPAKDEPKKDAKKDEAKKPDGKDAKKDEMKSAFRIDLDGIQNRVLALPVSAGTFNHLSSTGGSVYYHRGNRKSGGPPGFFVFDVGAKKETSLGAIGGYEISADGKKMLVAKDGNFGIIDLPKGPFTFENLNLSGLRVKLDHHQEWTQIFNEAWRQMRDFFYDPGLHGNDWKAIKARYAPLVAHVNHRADLSYIIGEMISELNAGHAYVGGGEAPKAARIQTGLLGAELRRDPASGYPQIAKILAGASWDPDLRSPLMELGVNASVGDFIVAIEGKSTKGMPNIFEELVGTVGKQVRLTINKNPAENGGREVVVEPIADEHPLYYHAWVQANIKKVSDATNGQIGYLHVPDMLSTGLNEFVKHYYPQLRKKALIIDVRGNGGGNVSPMIIERLRREPTFFSMARNTAPKPNPTETFLGPLACLMNEFSASDGDIFPYRFRHYKLGKLIGKRSWGGTIGIRGSLPFLDGGSLNKPEFASYDLAGKKWTIEGYGVDPDIVVDNDPSQEFAGTDQQLNRAIQHLLEELRNRPAVGVPPIPAFPKR